MAKNHGRGREPDSAAMLATLRRVRVAELRRIHGPFEEISNKAKAKCHICMEGVGDPKLLRAKHTLTQITLCAGCAEVMLSP